MALEETGLEFIADGAEAFTDAITDAGSALFDFEGIGESVSKTFDAFEEVVTGALRHVGEIAVDTLLEAGGAIIDFAESSFDGALDAEKGIKKLSGAIKRMGTQSPITEKEALQLAESMKHLAGGSDDAVIAAEAVLLKFQSISRDVFPDALEVSLDLAEILGTDAANAAEQLGKALEHPEGASRLLKQAGIFLIDSEKDLLKQFEETGNAAAAQNFVLDKLAKTTGGAASDAANTLSGSWEIFTETISDAGEGIILRFIPYLQMLFDTYIKPNIPIIESFADSIGNVIDLLITGDFKGGIFGLQEDNPLLGMLLGLREIGISVIGWITGTALPALIAFGDWFVNEGVYDIEEFVNTAWTTLQNAFTEILPIIQPVIDSLGRIWEALRADDPEAFTKAIDDLFSTASAAFDKIWDKYIKPALIDTWNKLVRWVNEQVPKLEAEWNKWQPAISEWLTSVWVEKIEPELNKVIDNIFTWIEDQKPILQKKVKEEWGPAIGDFRETAIPEFIKSLGAMTGAGVAWLLTTGIPDVINAITSGFTNGTPGMTKRIVDGFIIFFQIELARIRSLFYDFFNSFLSSFSANINWQPLFDSIMNLRGIMQAVSWSLGWHIMQGIAEGINNAQFFVFSAIWNGVWDAIQFVKRMLGIHSPSDASADILGQPIGGGVAKGIWSMYDDIVNALKGVTSGAMSMVSPVSTNGFSGGVTNNNSSSKAFNLNVNSGQSSQGIISDFSVLQAMT